MDNLDELKEQEKVQTAENVELVEVNDDFTKEELAMLFNALGEIPVKLNSKEAVFVLGLRDKIKEKHENTR